MRRNRTGLLLAVAVTFACSAPVAAQVAPGLTGQTGLFELTNNETLHPGRFSLGLFYSNSVLIAAPSPSVAAGADGPLQYKLGTFGLTVGYGLTPGLEASLSLGSNQFDADARVWSGVVGGHDRQGALDHAETDKVRVGFKYVLNSKNPEPMKVALFGAMYFPTQSRSDQNALSTYRADYDLGLSFNYGVATIHVDYLLAGDFGDRYDVSNQLTAGLGLNFQLIPKTLRAIGEIKRVHYDGGTTQPTDYWQALAGARFALADTGFVVGGALRVNFESTKYDASPRNGVGALVQLAWMPQVASTGPAKALPARENEPAAEPSPAIAPAPAAAPSPSAPVPAPVTEPAPAPKAETSTTDEVLFDAAKSRLTNIAKAILDGVALRLKNNLSATCTVAAHTDPKEKGGDHAALAKARADAAKDYLVKRHGIDPGRIKTEMKGDAEAGPDSLRNRRAVVTVTFP